MIGEIFLDWVEAYGEYAVFIVPVIAFLEALSILLRGFEVARSALDGAP